MYTHIIPSNIRNICHIRVFLHSLLAWTRPCQVKKNVLELSALADEMLRLDTLGIPKKTIYKESGDPHRTVSLPKCNM